MKKFLLAVLVFTAASAVFAQFDISVAGKKGDDTLIFRGFTGSEDMRRQVEKDLQNCGWFEIIKSGVSNFMITGSSSGPSSLRLELMDGAGTKIASVNASGATVAETSHKAVDAILRFLYKVDGLCSTKIAFVAEIAPMRKEIYICDYDGSNFQRITRNNGLSLEPIWTPNGKSIVYSFIGKAFNVLMEVNPSTGKSRQLARFNGLNAGGAVSASGKIAMVLSKENRVDLHVRNLDGGTPVNLTKDKAVEASPCWSADGSKICFVSDSGYGRPRLRVISAAGGRSSSVPGVLGSESVSPDWSKDGKIAYSAKLGSYAICIADLEGVAEKEPRQKTGVIVSGSWDWESPSWAPDNRHLVCSSRGGLYIVDSWTGKYRQIVGGKSKCSLPDWSAVLR